MNWVPSLEVVGTPSRVGEGQGVVMNWAAKAELVALG